MALYIKKDNDYLGPPREREIHLPFTFEHTKDAHTVGWIQADGDELEYIKERFNMFSAPMPKGFSKIVRWYGDQAKFIIGNLV